MKEVDLSNHFLNTNCKSLHITAYKKNEKLNSILLVFPVI